MKTFKQFLDLLSEAPLPPNVNRSIERHVQAGLDYQRPEDWNMRKAVHKDTGYELPANPPSGVSRIVVGDDSPLKIKIHNGPNDKSPFEYHHPTVTKIYRNISTNPHHQNISEFDLRDEHSVLLPHPNGKKHHYINNFEHGVLAPSFEMSHNGEYLIAGKVQRASEGYPYFMHTTSATADEIKNNNKLVDDRVREWTKTSDHPGVSYPEYSRAVTVDTDIPHPNSIVRQHQKFFEKTGMYDLHAQNLGGYTDPVSEKTKLVILDAGQ